MKTVSVEYSKRLTSKQGREVLGLSKGTWDYYINSGKTPYCSKESNGSGYQRHFTIDELKGIHLCSELSKDKIGSRTAQLLLQMAKRQGFAGSVKSNKHRATYVSVDLDRLSEAVGARLELCGYGNIGL